MGLLNVGTEENKGTKLVQDAFKLLKENNKINFIGFVNGRDFSLGKMVKADIVAKIGQIFSLFTAGK